MRDLTVGLDVGAGSTKAALLEDGTRVLRTVRIRTGPFMEKAAQKALTQLLEEADVKRDAISYLATTGYGRYAYADRDTQITEITCHARGARLLFPGTRCVLDIGAQSSRAMRVDEKGRVQKFLMNDRCAAGAGRFLERIAKSLEIDVPELGQMALRAKDPQPISSICAVLAESEVINHVTQGRPAADIVAGAHNSIADRTLALLRQVGLEAEVTLTGGLSLNPGVVRALEERLKMKINATPDSPFAGAIGAAQLGHWRLKRRGTDA